MQLGSALMQNRVGFNFYVILKNAERRRWCGISDNTLFKLLIFIYDLSKNMSRVEVFNHFSTSLSLRSSVKSESALANYPAAPAITWHSGLPTGTSD